MITLVATSAAVTAGNMYLRSKKKSKAKQETLEMFQEHGYYISKKDLDKLFRGFYIGETVTETLDAYVENFRETLFQFVPLINVYFVIENIRHLKGKKTTQDFYNHYADWNLYDRTLPDGTKPLEYLENNGLVKVSHDLEEEIKDEKTNIIDFKQPDYPTSPVKRNTAKLVLEPRENEFK